MNKDITLEDLEYKHNCKDKDLIVYEKAVIVGIVPTKICFNITETQLYLIRDEEMIILDESLLQAIYNKCKELGCLDE